MLHCPQCALRTQHKERKRTILPKIGAIPLRTSPKNLQNKLVPSITKTNNKTLINYTRLYLKKIKKIKRKKDKKLTIYNLLFRLHTNYTLEV